MKAMFVALILIAVVPVTIVAFPREQPALGPEPIQYGKDACARCRMFLSPQGFAGQMRTSDGQLTKYDDLGCLLIAMWKEHREVPGVFVEARDTGRLTPLLTSTLVVDSRVKTPMAYGIIAFEELAAAQSFVQEHGGKIESLEAVLKDSARFRVESHNQKE